MCELHPTLCNINLHSVTHFEISRKPQGTEVRSSNLTPYCHISLPYITDSIINANCPRSQPTPSCCVMCQYVECYLIVLICHIHTFAICHIALEGQVEWTTPHHTVKMLDFVSFHSVTCYTNSNLSCIHVNTTKHRNVMCTLVATSVILWSLECSYSHLLKSGPTY